MRRTASVIAALAGAGVLFACGSSPQSGRTGLGSIPATDLGFVRHADAVQWPSASDFVPPGHGLRLLLPVGDCARAIGDYQNGYRAVTANWIGEPACDRLRLDPAPDGTTSGGDGPPDAVNGWRGGGISAQAAVVERDGSILAADDAGLARYRGEVRQELARADLSTAGLEGQGSRSLVRGMAVTRSGRIVVDAGMSTKDGYAPVVLRSDDHGASLRPVPLPSDPGLDGPERSVRQVISVLAADGDTVVALGSGFPRTSAWRSTDGGRTWSVSAVTGLPPQLMLTRLVHAGGRWVALGGVERSEQGAQDDTYVLTSTDGRTWRPGATGGLGAGRAQDVTVDRSGELIVVGVIDDSRPVEAGKRADSCGVVWIGDGVRAWKRGELGCGEAPPQAVTTLRDGRVLIAGNRDLWLRAAGVPGAA
ncbi:WD40/YVTN/BNR-like repeat-containing protein [Nucisporomicrobium flavum]|uniref:WD40/YVTN/BNR-like repeat-containing protein n=1 Tax=Nucisporomicrobium flavum TaxID=2785915 RepID=UPI003C2DBB5D